MATLRVLDNILEKDSVRTLSLRKGEIKTMFDAVEMFAPNDAYQGRLVECYDPETGETTYETLDEGNSLSVALFANGEEVSVEYEIRDDDELFIIVLPSGGRNSAGIFGALIGIVVGVAIGIFTAGGGFAALPGMGLSSLMSTSAMSINGIMTGILYGLAGGIAGYALGISLYDMFHRPDGGANKEGLEGNTYYGVKGTKNQSLLGKNYPFILGRHIITPPYIAQPYSRSDGKYGESQTIALAFAAGYAPLRLTNFMLGDLILAYNKPINANGELSTIMHGKLKNQAPTTYSEPHWINVPPESIPSMIASGDLIATSKTVEYMEEVVGSGGSSAYGSYSIYSGGQWYTRRKATRTVTEYKPGRAGVRVLSQSIYSQGQVQVYGSTETSTPQDNGEILRRWLNNDVQLEILQQNPNGNIDWGTVVTKTILQDEINATPLYVCDGLLEGVAIEFGVTYKGCYFDNGFRNNSVRFTRANPMKIEVELEASNGIYKTWQHSDDNGSEVRYAAIPCWYAIQWRPYSSAADDSNSEGLDKIPWRSFEHINRYEDSSHNIHQLSPQVYTQELHDADINAHTGATHIISGASSGWIGQELFNLGALVDTLSTASTSEDRDKERLSQQRMTAVVDLSTVHGQGADSWGGLEWLRKNVLNLDDGNPNYVGTGSNTNHTIEVRVIRVSPCYLNESKAPNTHDSAAQFTDVVKWNNLTTFTFDKEKLEKPLTGDDTATLEAEKITTEEEMRKLCVVGLKVKADTGGNVQNQLNKFNFIAESFSPVFREIDGEVKVLPENIHKEDVYYKAVDYDSETNDYPKYDLEHPITKAEYEQARQEKWPAIKRKKGCRFNETILNEIYQTPLDADGRLCLTQAIKDKYVDNNSASSAMLALLGRQNGIDALGYEDLNLDSFSDFYEFCKEVYDGSTYPADEVVVLDDLSSENHSKGEPIGAKFTCNACVQNGIKVETLLAKCLATGRALFTRDENNKIKVVIDKERDNPVMLINQQNTISGSNLISYESLPAGLQFNFEDEEDYFAGHSVSVMADGEDRKNPTKEIENYSIDFVTNRHQLNMLGRYVLASREMQRETLQRKIGPEGFCAELGDLVKVSDDSILIGTDHGGRVKEIIEDSQKIYGIVTDETFEFTGETVTPTDSQGNPILDGNNQPIIQSVQGVEVMQPTKFNAARVVSYRCAMAGRTLTLWRVVIDGNIYSVGDPTQGARTTAPDGTVYVNDVTITVDGTVCHAIDNTETKKAFDGHIYGYYFLIDDEPYPLYEQEYKMAVGKTNVVLFDKPISKDDQYHGDEMLQITKNKPELDDIVAFGKVGQSSALYTITKIKPDANFNFDLTLVQYTDQVFLAGMRLPELKNNMTIPDRSGEDYYPLSNSLTPDELQRMVQTSVSSGVNGIIDGDIEVSDPDTPVVRKALAVKEGIQLEIAPLPKKGLSNTVTKVVWQVAKVAGDVQTPSESDWDGLIETGDKAATYLFDRSTDGYPERSDLHGTTERETKWWLRVKVVNDYGKESPWSSTVLVNADTYGTWIPQRPVISNLNEDKSTRFVTLDISQPSGQNLYATVAYRVGVKRADRLEEPFYLPNVYGDPFGNENTYKEDADHQAVAFNPATSGHFIEVQRTFKQNVPLIGQNETIYKNKLVKTAANVPDAVLQTWYTEDQMDSESEGSYDDNGTVIRFDQMTWTTSEGVNTGTMVVGDYTYALTSSGELASNPEPTVYTYKIVPYAIEPNVVHTTLGLEASVRVEPNTIQDIVNNSITSNKLAPDAVVAEKIAAGTITADKMAVDQLSAITANMGAITDGALAGNSNNFWALTAGTYNGVYRAKGTFRVGDNNNYIEVKAYNRNDEEVDNENKDDGEFNTYRLFFKAGTFEVTSEISTFQNDFAIYQDGNMSRLFMTASGMSLQRLAFQEGETIPDPLEQSYWNEHPNKIVDVAKFFADTSGNLIVTNAANTSEIGFATEVPEGVTVYQLNSQFIHTGEFVDLDGVDSKTLNISSNKLATGQSLPFLKRRNGNTETECCDGTIDVPSGTQFMVYNKGCFLDVGGDKIQIDDNPPESPITTAFNENISTSWGLTVAQTETLRMVTV